jgi:hypothetical protein
MRQRYEQLVRGEYERAGLEPPVSGPRAYRHMVRRWLERHDLDPLGDPEQLARAEGLQVSWRGAKRGCGIHAGNVVIVAWTSDPALRSMTLHHERAHALIRQLGAPHATEADVMWASIELALPHSERDRWPTAAHAPPWLWMVAAERFAA